MNFPPSISPRTAAALRAVLDREYRWAKLAQDAGCIAWDGRTAWRSQIGAMDAELMQGAEADGLWSPPSPPDGSGDDPLRAGPARDPRR